MKRVTCMSSLLLTLLFTTSKVATQPYRCYYGASVCCEFNFKLDGPILKSELWTIRYTSGSTASVSASGEGRVCETDVFGPTECWPKFNVATVIETTSKSDGYEYTRALWEKKVINQSTDMFCGCRDTNTVIFRDERTCSSQAPIDQ